MFATIGQPDSLAAYLVIAIATTAALLARPRRSIRVAAGLSLGLMVAALVLTESRGGYLGLAVAGVVAVAGLLWIHDAHRVRIGWTLLAVGLVVIALCAVGAVAPEPDRRSLAAHLGGSGRHAVTCRTGHTSTSGTRAGWSRPTIRCSAPARTPSPRSSRGTWTNCRNGAGSRSPSVASRARTTSTWRSPWARASRRSVRYLALIALTIGAVIREARRSRDASTRMLLVMLTAAIPAGHLVTDLFMTADLVASWLQWILLGADSAWRRTSRWLRTANLERATS